MKTKTYIALINELARRHPEILEMDLSVSAFGMTQDTFFDGTTPSSIKAAVKSYGDKQFFAIGGIHLDEENIKEVLFNIYTEEGINIYESIGEWVDNDFKVYVNPKR